MVAGSGGIVERLLVKVSSFVSKCQAMKSLCPR